MNLYVDLTTFKTALGVASTTKDAEILRILESVSREADDCCRRHFYTETGTRYFTPLSSTEVFVDDLLSISAVDVDTSGTSSYSEALTEGTHYFLSPRNKWPRTALRLLANSNKSFPGFRDGVRIAGTYGYGNGRDSNPWRALSVTGTCTNSSTTTLTLSAAGSVAAGKTLKIENEQVYVESVSSTTATVRRGVNGTTAAGHTTATVYAAEYPAQLVEAVRMFAAQTFSLLGKESLKDVMIGEYRETLVWDDRLREKFEATLGLLKRPAFYSV